LGIDTQGLVAARRTAIVADLGPLAMLDINGRDAEAFLQGQLSNDVKALIDGVCQYTSYNSPKGRMLANLLLWRSGPDAFHALLPAELADAVVQRLRRYVLRAQLTIADRSVNCRRFGVGGPEAATVVQQSFAAAPGPFAVARSGDAVLLGLPGRRYVVIVPAAAGDASATLLARHARPADFIVWEWLTIDAGIPVITGPTQELFVAQMLNWDVVGGVSFQKGCYPGQEIVARTRYLGRVKERLYAFHADLPLLAPGTRLYSSTFGDQPCGTVVNAAPAPEGGTDLLAVVQTAAVEARDLRLASLDGLRVANRALPYAVPAATTL
jgi:folate-binding protein YgfZ